MQRNMSEVRHNECKNKPHYFEMFLSEADKQKQAQPAIETTLPGIGTELERLIGWMKPGGCDKCMCSMHARQMDKRGIAWCKMRSSLIVRWMQQGAKDCGIPFSATAARWVLRLAIRNVSKRTEQKRIADGTRIEPTPET